MGCICCLPPSALAALVTRPSSCVPPPLMSLHSCSCSRVALLECGARPTDRGWYTHHSTWPAAAAPEGSGDIWACVAADGRLRVFDGPTATSRTLLHSVPVLGPVLSLALWSERRVAITLEECQMKENTRCDRIIRFYSWATREREVVELAAIDVDQLPGSRIFSPSILSLCTETRVLALAHDTNIRLYQLDDIFAESHNDRDDLHPPPSSADDPEPGAECKAAPSVPIQLAASASPLRPTHTHTAHLPTTPARVITATFPHTRRFIVKVFQILPALTLQSPYAVRHLDYKRGYLTYSSYNECRLLHLQLERIQPGRLADIDREAHHFPRYNRIDSVSSSPLPPATQAARATPPLSHSRSSGGVAGAGHRSTPSVSLQPFEHIGLRPDPDLRLDARDDILVRRIDLLLHRRGGPADQIHTVRLISPLEARKETDTHQQTQINAQPINPDRLSSPHTRKSSAAFSPVQPAAASLFVKPRSRKQDLFDLLGQGLPTGSFTAISDSHPYPSTSNAFVPSSSFRQPGGMTIEMMDEEDGPAILEKLEEIEDDIPIEDEPYMAPDASPAAAAPSGTPASSVESRTNGHIYLPMRLIITSSEECHLYDLEAHAKLATYYFEHDLVSLSVRSAFLIALTTHGLEVHSLWYSHPMVHYLTLPLRIAIEEPIQCNNGPLRDKVSDMIVVDNYILLRPAPLQPSPHLSHHPHDLLGASPPTHLIVPTDEVDPCESWPTMPVKSMPSVSEVVATSVQPPAVKSMQSSSEATPSSIRLFTEALLLLVQRCAQLRVLIARATRVDSDACALSVSRLRHEHSSVVIALSSINAYLATLFLTIHEVGLACYFSFYHVTQTQGASLEKLWETMQREIQTPKGGDTHTPQAKYLTKLIVHILIHPTPAEKESLLASPSLVASILSHIGLHAPHILGSLLLKSFLLHCPYEPRQVLRILEENGAKANYAASATMAVSGFTSPALYSYRPSRAQSSSTTPTASGGSGSPGAFRVRPVVFHTFVQALMHLQLCSSNGGGSKDSASILLNSFSTQSLEVLLLTHASLLTSWLHRHQLVDLLRASLPWSLLEVLVILTQRGEIHVDTGVTLLLGASQAAAVVLNHTDDGDAGCQAAASSTLPLLQLQAYLESSIAPFMLSNDIGAILESANQSIEPWDMPADKNAYLRSACDRAKQTTHNMNERFIPLHIRQHHIHHPGTIVLAQPIGEKAITRGQVAALAAQLACFYVQYGLSAPCASSSPRRSTSSSAIAGTPSSIGTPHSSRRTGSVSVSCPSFDFSARHSLCQWWRVGWLDSLRGVSGVGGVGYPNEDESKIRRLQALLSGPMPMQREQWAHIVRLIKQMPSDAPNAVPVKASLLMIALPRVGELPAALRLVAAHSPEVLWPFAQIYCGEPSHLLSHHLADSILGHWRLLHGILLMHILYSTHSTSVLHLACPSLPLPGADTDVSSGRTMLGSLLPAPLVAELLNPIDPTLADAIPAFEHAMTDMTTVNRANLYHQLYVFLLEQLVQRHTPSEFLSFIPQVGSARFYMPYVNKSFHHNAHAKAQSHDTDATQSRQVM